jgi:hypothetical protein
MPPCEYSTLLADFCVRPTVFAPNSVPATT